MQEELVDLIMERDERRKKQRILEDILSEAAYVLKDDLGMFKHCIKHYFILNLNQFIN